LRNKNWREHWMSTR